MIRKITLFFLACLGFAATYAQPLCGSDLYRQKLMTDPNYAALQSADRTAWSNYMSSIGSGLISSKIRLTGGDSVYEIPTVVHIIHDGGAVGSNFNPTDAQIASMIDYLNKSLEATWTGYPTTSTGGTRVPIRFTLAKRSPSCGTTTGIIRINGATSATLGTTYVNNGVNASGSSGVSDGTLKAVSYWPSSDYYNIWLVNKIDGQDGIPPLSGPITTGYAYMPPVSNPAIDGMLMLAYLFNPSSYGASTLPHEVGHSFSLFHTFEGSFSPANACPANTNCTLDGDLICDTEPEKAGGVSSCPTALAINSCTGSPYGSPGIQNNFMTYSNCTARKFTPGQRNRMMYSLKMLRGSLITSLGATNPSTITAAACTPSHTGTSGSGPGRIVITQGTFTPQDTLMHMVSAGYTGDGNLAYIDKTCKHRIELTAGVTYRIRVYRGSTFTTDRVKAYIDWNNDGDFVDAGEQIWHNGFPSPTSNNYVDTSIVPPLTGITNCVPIRMRIVAEPAGTPINNFNSCSLVNGQAEDYEVIIKGVGTSSSVTGAVTLTKPPVGGNPSCFNTSLTIQSNVSTAILPVGYRWYKKSSTGFITAGPASGTATEWTSTAFQDRDTVYLKVAFSGPCGIDTAISDSLVIFRVLSVNPAVTIGQTWGTNPGCPDDSVVYSVVSNVNPGGSPTYSWYLNGSATPIQTGSQTYLSMKNVPSGTTVQVVMQSSASAPCAPPPGRATSNTLTYTHGFQNPSAQIALTMGTNPGCQGQTLTFTALTTYGGTAPTYQWRVNGVNAGTNSPTFSGVFNHNDVIDYIFTSNSTCVQPADRTKTSTSIKVEHVLITANITIAVVAGNHIACQGKPVLYAANTTNAGSNPGFEWMINGVPVPNSNSPLFQSSTMSNGDAVSCILHATDPCVANPDDTSNAITMVIRPSATPQVTIAITAGKNPWCLDSMVEFTATAINATSAGTTPPHFEWLVNGFESYTGAVFQNAAYLNGDVVVCRVNPTDGECYLPDTVFSAPYTMIRSTLPDPPIIHLVGNMLITNKAGTYKWWGPAGLYSTGTNGTFHPTEKGQYMAVTDNNGCWSLASNYLIITLLDVSTVDLAPVNIYPNPTNGELVLDWGTQNVNVDIMVHNTLGQQIIHDEVKGLSRKVMDLSKLTPGIYYIVMKDDNGNSGTAKITVSR
ncbi:MAG: T9SS type A sorting domain-containing protein [Sphingobacteriales bacterium]|nr:MAG: T9SS type A sorting domain-containing protein [Sphingobacteriales bacterium]